MPSVIHVSDFTIPGCNYLGTTAKLRRYYDSNWTDVDGVLRLAGTPGSSTEFFDETDCTLANNTLTVPAFDTTPTLNALINSGVKETWQLWDEAGSPRNIIADSWFIPTSPTTTTRALLAVANQGQTLLWPPSTYLNQVGVQALIDQQGSATPATTVMQGIGKTSAPSAVAGNPIFLEQNDPAVVTLTGAQVLTNKTLNAPKFQTVLFADLPASPDGTMVYCSDVLESSFPAVGGGSGSFCLRINGIWRAL